MSANIFSNIYNGPFKRYLLLSKNIGQDVQNQSEITDLAFQAELRFIEYSENFKKPLSINLVLNPIIHQIDKTKHYVCSDPSLADHITVVAQSINALLWILEKDPVNYLEGVISDAKIYTDILLVFFKDKDMHVEWVEAWLETLNELNNFARRKYPKGLTWKGELEIPPSELLQDLTEFQTLNDDNLFKEMNKTESVQEALRKLSSQSDELAQKPEDDVSPSNAVFLRDGKNWIIEHQRSAKKQFTISEADLDTILSIYDCKNITVVLESKITVIKLNNCEKLSVIFRSLISGIEVISCKDLKLHSFGTLPSITVDTCSDINIHLTKKALDAQVVTSRCSKISLSYPMEDGYYKTYYIPSRMMTTINPDHSLRNLPIIDE